MINFRLQHNDDLIARLMLLDYLRKLGASETYKKATDEEKKKYFYKFSDEKDNIYIDYNWEALLFKAQIYELEKILILFEDKIEEINKQELEHLKKLKELREEEKVASISIYDIAKAEIEKSKDKSRLILSK